MPKYCLRVYALLALLAIYNISKIADADKPEKMNGPMIMYDLKPVVQFSDTVELTPTMYRMKNIIFSSTLGSQDSSIFPNISEQVNKILQVSSFNV